MPPSGEPSVKQDTEAVNLRAREGRFQRWLSLAAGLSSILSGLEVGYEHYKGSYSRRIMYTPVILSEVLMVTGVAGFFSPRVARTLLPAVSALTLLDGGVGFYFHVRGVARKPGGWRLPIVNIVMGPPLFAPLLFGVSAYLGLIASFLRRDEGDAGGVLPQAAHPGHWGAALSGKHEPIDAAQDAREGRFQRQIAAAAALSAFLSGAEACYSHYKNNFQYKVQYTPLIVSSMLMVTGMAAVKSVRVAHTALPAVSGLAILNGTVGFGYHLRGVLRKPGGTHTLLYNIAYGPPIFAPLLFAASGFLGVLASLLRRSPQ